MDLERGKPMREVTIPNDRVIVVGDECESPWSELGTRLEEAACNLGAGPWRTYFEVTLPLRAPRRR